MRVILDTNVIISAFASKIGAPAHIFSQWEAQAFEVVVSPSILAEYERVFRYDKLKAYLKLSESEIVQLLERFRKFAILVDDGEIVQVIVEDPEDDKFLACAVNGEVEYIVSGDAHLLKLQQYKGIQILSPAIFLALLNQLEIRQK